MKKVLKKIVSVLPVIFILLAVILVIQLTVTIKKGETPSYSEPHTVDK